MLDRFGRPLTSLRISVTSDCNLNCFYCHREGCLEGSHQMSANEIGKIVKLATEFGIRKVKLTGGEPLLRSDIVEIVGAVAESPIVDVSLSTNGTLLAKTAQELVDAGLNRINISLDTLDPETYAFITGKRLLENVLAGVDAAVSVGLEPVKLNMVVLAGINDREIEHMIAYAAERGAILQLIELLRVPSNERIFDRHHRKLKDVEKELRKRAVEIKMRKLMHNRKKYILPQGEVEIVNPMHNSEFCMHCTRLRLTPDGYLKPCLMRNDNLVDVLSPLRAADIEAARAAFKEAVAKREPYFKPLR